MQKYKFLMKMARVISLFYFLNNSWLHVHKTNPALQLPQGGIGW